MQNKVVKHKQCVLISIKILCYSAATGLNQYANANFNIQLYPNPFSSSVKVDINATNSLDENKTVINVYDILGNIVRTEKIKLTENYSNVFDFSNLTNGSM